MNRNYLYVFSGILLFVFSCSKKDELSDKFEGFLGFKNPKNFPEPTYNFTNNPITEEGFKLGRTLFYETALSVNNTISCGSCHIQAHAFTHHGHDVSHGVEDRLGIRNSQAIMNLAWSKSFMWDGGVFNLDLQPLAPITAHEEMDEEIGNVIVKLSKISKYPTMFKAAFGSEEITTARLMKALSQFMLMCISSNSKYDKVMRGEDNQQFTNTEAAGYTLFKQKCASCHSEPLFTDDSFRNNGIGKTIVNDKGRYEITLNPADEYKFKVPSLRNLKYTTPYMHNGSFITLEAVLEHYNAEVKDSETLDHQLKQNGILGIPLTTLEKQNLLAFLETLNDESFLKNKLLSEQ